MRTIPQRITSKVRIKYKALVTDNRYKAKYSSDSERKEIEEEIEYLQEALIMLNWINKTYKLSISRFLDYLNVHQTKKDWKFYSLIKDLIVETKKILPNIHIFNKNA